MGSRRETKRETREGINLYYNEKRELGKTEKNTQSGGLKNLGFGEMKGVET